MRSLRRAGWLSALAVLLATGCTIAPPAGSPMPPAAELLPGDGRVFAYGYTVDEVLKNPMVGDKIRDLFWIDWMPASQGGGQLSTGARAYFAGNAPLRMVRVGGVDYIALTGCEPSACNTHRVLVLIRDDGSQLLARLDEGGFALLRIRQRRRDPLHGAPHRGQRASRAAPWGRSLSRHELETERF